MAIANGLTMMTKKTQSRYGIHFDLCWGSAVIALANFIWMIAE